MTRFAPLALLLTVTACSQDTAAPPPPPAAQPAAPRVDPIAGAPAPSLLLSQAWFTNDAEGKPVPAPARLEIWRNEGGTWKMYRLEDPDSNVFHKAVPWNGGVLTIGAEGARLKHWKLEGGSWKGTTLWERSWGGKFNRLRDLEIGDVDGDGKDELVLASHDAGVVAVVNPDEGPSAFVELDHKADTFVHEVEICDVDGDGKLEFLATPSDRNQAGKSQHGLLVMYRWDGAAYQRSIVDPGENTHAKEALCADVDGDGKAEVYGVFEAELGPARNIVTPVTIYQYFLQPDGSFTHEVAATIDDTQTRFLLTADVDHDGEKELVAAAMKKGIFVFDKVDGRWQPTTIDTKSGGFEHATIAHDLDGDGRVELYVAADDQRELRKYWYDVDAKLWNKEVIGPIADGVFTWGVTATTL